ncbi:MAG: hypothetical protein K6E12_00690 [Saccharofermentans sp.]|nr:hypothetical protein [Saccharofermentans sp.]
MVFDAFEGLSDEYRSYQVIQPEQLNFREPANDAERDAAGALIKRGGQESIILIFIGIVLAVIGILAAFSSLGGIVLAVLGIPLIVFGIIRYKKGKSPAASLITTGVLVKKESQSAGSINNKSKRTYRWLVIAVNDIPNTLCIVRADPDEFDEARVGDTILVTNNKSIYRGRKLM